MASPPDHTRQVLHWRVAAKLCQCEELEQANGICRESTYQLAKRHLVAHGSIERKNAFTKTRRLALLLDKHRISEALRGACAKGRHDHTCLDACRSCPQAVLLWRKLWYSLPKADRDYRLAGLFRGAKDASNNEGDFKTNFCFLGQGVCRQAFIKLTGINTCTLQNARKLALGT